MSHNWKLINMPDAVELNQLPFIFTHWLLTNDCNKNVWLNGFFLVGSGKIWNISELFHLWWPPWDARLNISDPLSMVTQKTTHFGICLWSMIPFFFLLLECQILASHPEWSSNHYSWNPINLWILWHNITQVLLSFRIDHAFGWQFSHCLYLFFSMFVQNNTVWWNVQKVERVKIL